MTSRIATEANSSKVIPAQISTHPAPIHHHHRHHYFRRKPILTLISAVLYAAQSFGTTKKPKTGLAGYCASLRDTRPQDFALLVTKATARRSLAVHNAAAYAPIVVEFVTCPSNYFLPHDEARNHGPRTGSAPVLVVDNEDDDTDTFSDPPEQANDDPLDEPEEE